MRARRMSVVGPVNFTNRSPAFPAVGGASFSGQTGQFDVSIIVSTILFHRIQKINAFVSPTDSEHERVLKIKSPTAIFLGSDKTS